jgi:hypothetical protein
MLHAKQWTVEVFISEDEDSTRVEARLAGQDKTTLVGHGRARLNPHDANVPEIGDELAVARALADLSHQLLDAAAGDIEGVTHRRAHVNG